jgi:glycosyltransferase involved in cell wall biosynthesis
MAESISSVIAQTYTDWELILIDDASDDNSVDIARGFADGDNRIKVVVLHENGGPAVARNEGIRLANGRYIAFLDSDDVWYDNKLESQVAYMVRESIPFTYSAYQKVNVEGDVIGHVGVPPSVTSRDLLKTCHIGCLTAMYDTHELGKVYMPLIRKRQDLGLWLKILGIVPRAFSTPGVLAKYRVGQDSVSSNKRIAALYTWQLYRNHAGLTLLSAVYYFIHYAFNGVLRTNFPALARMLGVLK